MMMMTATFSQCQARRDNSEHPSFYGRDDQIEVVNIIFGDKNIDALINQMPDEDHDYYEQYIRENTSLEMDSYIDGSSAEEICNDFTDYLKEYEENE